MAITAADIKYYLSGGAANSNPVLSFGGARSTTALVDNTADNLFPDAPGSETLAGSIKYLCLYVRNENATLTFQNVKLYVTTGTTSTEDEIDLALGAAAKNGTETAVANINTAPSGPTFSHPTTYAGGITIPDLAPNDFQSFWLRDTINASLVTPVNTNTFVFDVDGDTAA